MPPLVGQYNLIRKASDNGKMLTEDMSHTEVLEEIYYA